MSKVLVVVDMQNDFVNGALGTAEAVAIVDSVVDKIENHKGDIIVTYDTHKENYLETNEGRNLPVIHCIEETEGWQLNEKVEKAILGKGALRLKKPTFGSMKLVEMLSDRDEHEMEITLIGLCTDICVVSNALLLKAAYPEAHIIVDAACCAGVTPESHTAALATMEMCQIEVINKTVERGVPVIFDEDFVKESIADNFAKDVSKVNIADYAGEDVIESIDYHMKALNGKRPFELTSCCVMK